MVKVVGALCAGACPRIPRSLSPTAKTIYLVACSKRKQAVELPAEQLYKSRHFRMCEKYVAAFFYGAIHS